MNENRLKKVKLSSGELDFGTISRGKCVFFMFRDGERNNYYGPDEQTNKLSRDFDGFEDYCTSQGISSDDRGVYHFGVNNYLCNGAWASVNFNIPGIIKVMVKADDDADFHEIVAGSDYRFSNNVKIKLAYKYEVHPRTIVVIPIRPEIPPLLKDNLLFSSSLQLVFLHSLILVDPIHQLAHAGGGFAS